MEFIIRGDKIKITDAMKSYIEEKLGKLDKYLKNAEDIRAKVIVKSDKKNQRVEVTIPLKSYILRSEEGNADFYAAVDKTIDKLERQIRKNKTRLATKKTNAIDFTIDAIEPVQGEKKITKRKTIEVKPMDEDEAILQMELTNHDFFVFKNADEKCTSVVYKRKDGTYGIINAR